MTETAETDEPLTVLLKTQMRRVRRLAAAVIVIGLIAMAGPVLAVLEQNERTKDVCDIATANRSVLEGMVDQFKVIPIPDDALPALRATLEETNRRRRIFQRQAARLLTDFEC